MVIEKIKKLFTEKTKRFFLEKCWFLITIVILIILPKICEKILFYTEKLKLSGFSKKEWFSFMGSYIGTIFAVVIMYITFYKTQKDYKNELIRQKKIDQIKSEREIIRKLKNIVLLDKYESIDGNFSINDYIKLCNDLMVTKVWLAQINKDEEDSAKNKLISRIEMIEASYQCSQIAIGNNFKNEDDISKRNNFLMEIIDTLIAVRNNYKMEVELLYYNYENEIKEIMYEE